jgi:hypothetical protein
MTRKGQNMKLISLIFMFSFVMSTPNSGYSADKITCTIEKNLTTGNALDKPMVSTEKVSLDAKPFGGNYTFSLAPAKAECELRNPNPKGGTFLNCWTLDKKHGFRSDRTTIDKKEGVQNTLTYADGEIDVVVQITVLCK